MLQKIPKEFQDHQLLSAAPRNMEATLKKAVAVENNRST
jgi:hypothetical protein